MHVSRLARRRLGVVVCALLFVLVAADAAIAQARALEVDDLRLAVGLSSPVLSPDGQYAVIQPSTPNYEDNRFDRTLVLVEVDTGEQRELTPHRHAVSAPRWSPSGEHLAFVDAAEEGEARQVFMLPLGAGEARQVTTAPDGVAAFEWTADGSQILYTTTDPATEREGEERHNRSFEVGDNSYLATEVARSVHLWRVAIEGGEAERLTSGAENMTGFVVSPDGRTVALAVGALPHSGQRIWTTIRLFDLESGETTEFVTQGPATPHAFSPDGSYLAYSLPRGPEPGFNPDGIFIKPVGGGDEIDVTPQIDRALNTAAWLPDGEALVVDGTDLTERAFWIQPIGGAPERLDLGDIHAGSAEVASNGVVVFRERGLPPVRALRDGTSASGRRGV
jgi:Tol biopolymer transport system component